jgi:hypothetical protein
MTQKISSVNIETATLASFSGPTIANVSIANSTYVLLDDTAVSNAGGYVVITGSNFQSGAQVLFGSTSACTVTFVDSTRLNVQVPALTAGSYVVYVQNGDGSTAIRLNGITSSPIPVWSTGSTLTGQDSGSAFSISLAASSDSSVTYSVANGSSLPSGTTLAANGLFSGTITIENETTYNFSVNAIDAENQETLRSFSVTVTSGDLYYNLTTLHLNGEPTSNSWISDASANSFALTVSGDTRPVAFSPYETNWGYYFDGTSDYLTIPNNANLQLGSGDFTVEGWFYPTRVSADIVSFYTKGVNTTGGIIFGVSTTTIWLRRAGQTDTTVPATLGNKWSHIAWVRSGSTLYIFLNGVSQTLNGSTSATFNNNDTGTVTIGSPNTVAQASFRFQGYASNFRIVKGTALYTSNFTPSTSTLTAVSNTSLLTCHSNRIKDDSTNAFTITRNGNPLVTNFGPFVETDTTTGSGYFDGTGDYLTVPDNTALDAFTDFTIEFWVYFNSVSGSQVVLDKGWNGSAIAPYLIYLTSGSLVAYASSGGTWNILNGSSFGTMTTGQWYHIALSRSNTSIRLFTNGSLVTTVTNGTTILNGTSALGIGGGPTAGANPLNGYISDVRIVKGTAVYTAAFTPPTAPLTAVANTSLLTLQNRMGENNSRIIDTSGINSIIVRSGNATQGTFSPFSKTGWSNYFDGTGDIISIANSNQLYPETTSSFTAECWVYINSGTQSLIIGQNSSTLLEWAIRVVAGVFTFAIDGVDDASSSSATTGQWHHVALVWDHVAQKKYGFVNGTKVIDVSRTSITVGAYDMTIGGRTGLTTWNLNGYVSNVRLLKGTALYTADFTPPTSPLTAIANTSLLTCQSNSFVDKSNNNFTITRSGDVSVQSFSPFKVTDSWQANTVGGSMYFDGNADFLTIASSDTIALSTGDFTWESWIYCDFSTLPTNATIYDQRNGTNGVSVIQPVIELTSATGYAWYVAAANRIASGTAPIKLRSWQHLAVARSSGVTKMFIDGVQVASNYTDTNNYPAGSLTIGRANDGSSTRYFTGYLSGLRVIRGEALYTANTTPPTSPPTSISNTVMLLTGTNGGIIDYTGRNNLETVGDAETYTGVKKYGSASMYFDGTGDRLIVPSNSNFDFGTSNFTIEMWINLTNVTSTWQAIISRAYGNAGGWRLYKNNGDNQLRWYHNTTLIVSTTGSTLTNNTWSHIAVVRSSGTTTIYIDGTSRGSAADTNSYIPGVYALEIGDGVVTSSFPMTGYIDDLRITKGYARYTSNFTPPTAALKTR